MASYMFKFLDDALMSNREHYFTHREIEELFIGRPLANDATHFESVKSNKKIYDSVTEAFSKIKEILINDYGVDFEYKKSSGTRSGYRYPLYLEDPMKRYKTKHKQMRIKSLEKLLQQSVGLLPQSWMADIVAGAQRLAKDDGAIIDFDSNEFVEHIQWVPMIFDAIEQRKVLKFLYRPKFRDKIISIYLHPFYLKEYDSRWFVFGHATYINEGKEFESYNCALDRIEGDITIAEDVEFKDSEKKFSAKKHFEDIVGVTKYGGRTKLKLIQIETQDIYTHKRIMTKRIHRTQHQERPFSESKKGLITIKVIPNNELDTLLMSFGANIKVLYSDGYGQHFYRKVEKLKNLYFPAEESKKEDNNKSKQKE